MIPYVDVPYAQKQRESRENRNQHFVEGLEAAVRKAKNPPSLAIISDKVLEISLIGTVHEDLVVRQMQKAYEAQNPDLFWTNQEKFSKLGIFKNDVAWFLYNNFVNKMDYSLGFKDIKPGMLYQIRRENRKKYNTLCKQMHEMAPKCNSLNTILLRI